MQSVQGELTKRIMTGVGITVLLFMISITVPPLGIISSFLIPIPILYYRLLLGRNNSLLLSVFVVIIMTVVLEGNLPYLYFFVEMMVLGFTMGECLERNLSIEKIVLYSCLAVLLARGVGIFYYGNITHQSVMSLLSGFADKMIEGFMAVYQNMEVPEEQLKMTITDMQKFKNVIVWILPSLTTISMVFVAWINLLIARLLLMKKNMLPPNFTSFNRFKAPEFLVWGVIVFGFYRFFGSNTSLRLISLNGLIILLTIYFLQGIAIVSFYFEKKRFHPTLRFILYGFIFLQQIFWIFMIGLGFFDIWLNFRKIGFDNNNQYSS